MKKNSSGFTLIEAVLAVTLLTFVTLAMFEGMSVINRFKRREKVLSERDALIAGLISSIQWNLQDYVYQIDFSTSLSGPHSTPLKWDRGIPPTESCTTCRGSLGLLIQPVENQAGIVSNLFRVTVALTYQGVFASPRNYTFFTSLED